MPSSETEATPGHKMSPGAAPTARINPKRKPDKSKIFRIRTSESEESFICPHCRAEYISREHFEEHVEICRRDPPVLPIPAVPPSENASPQSDVLKRHEDMANNNQLLLKSRDSLPSEPRAPSTDKNNGYDSDSNPNEFGPLAHIRQLLQSTSQMPLAQQLAQSNMTLEAIQNTRMALAQIASTTLGANVNNPQAMQEFAMLQGTLYTLQQQQMMQLQLIQQLQAQLSIQNKDSTYEGNKSNESEGLGSDNSETSDRPITPDPPAIPTAEPEEANHENVTSSFISSLMERFKPSKSETAEKSLVSTSTGPSQASPDPADKPISPPMIASSITSSVIQHTDPPPPDEPNTLEMLQRTANQVLNNASQGLLTNRLIDDYDKPGEGKDPYYKHRCRYCGKVFGSDSALQIHIRSHTGERPFKCNICGNRFTTKGNLKVHFQRHAQRFPHVKMNPHPVPEHLDKFHPPLLAQLGELKDYPPAPTGPPNPFSSPSVGPPIPPIRIPGVPHPLDLHKSFSPIDILKETRKSDREEPENLSNRLLHQSPPHRLSHMLERPDSSMDIDVSQDNIEAQDLSQDSSLKSFKRESSLEKFGSEKNEFSNHMQDNDDNDDDNDDDEENDRPTTENSLTKNMDIIDYPEHVRTSEHIKEHRDHLRDQGILKENSSSDEKENVDRELDSPLDIRIKNYQDMKDSHDDSTSGKEDGDLETIDAHSGTSEHPADLRMRPDFLSLGLPNMPLPGPRLPLSYPFFPGLHTFPLSAGHHTPISVPPGIDPCKDPHYYTNLLPRPGSSDNSWEALIEVQKTSETMKLEQLVNNIERKLTDPNQCIICHRVLSCKSALQMHYRTHTGERPFKCKICGRAFTTKGNLKTHMGVHRAKPPMRMLHQCPVCHKKYINALVLQQHIRMHTGEPTDLTAEQIAASEVRDFPPGLPGTTPLPHLLPTGFPLPPHPIPGFPQLPFPLRFQTSPEALRKYENEEAEDRISRTEEEDKYMRVFSTSSRSSSTGSAEQRTAEDLSVVRLREDSINGGSPTRRSISPTPSDYSDYGERNHDSSMQENRSSPVERPVSGSLSPIVGTSGGNQETSGIPLSLPLDLASRPPPPLFSPFGLFPPPLTSASISPGTASLPAINSIYMPSLPGRGNTTCQYCFKTFACHSALEIHYRSHTKERPFRCPVCERGFSTKGNMKQHMLTHKMRDESADSSDQNGPSPESNSSPKYSSLNFSQAPPATSTPLPPSASPMLSSSSVVALRSPPGDEDKLDSGIKREREGENVLPVPKRPSGAQSDEEVHPESLLSSRSALSPELASFITSSASLVSPVQSPRS